MSASPRRSAHNRPALIALVIIAALGCLGLAWWQWERYESATGTAQNLGYALQWPLFAGFAVFAYFRFVRLEREASEPEEKNESAAAPRPASAASRTPKPIAPTELPPGLLPERPKAVRDEDPVLAEYNRYLAALHANDIDEQVRAAGLHTRERSAG
ncbi:transcriptional regulator [Nocardia implantans]|uniref:Transcriptional regulator n=1 Tax=Nocardia implantans TaxID=3108168 RepID=A0ABU6APD7_9NOCA|nr:MULTISPECIES: transcriptional regulator [unclassified Nocardia]MBF6189595.1 transcriptional regulator [Nocardia beijingensis]MEA3527177.1 transcriptional regulator [Nocardia sp. CDC192]MEB3509245.1 transcriptional regulator [Nocardia sp. CDC186]